MKQRTKALRGSMYQTGRDVGMDFVVPAVEFVRLARPLDAERADLLASDRTASQAILFDDDVDGSLPSA